MELGANRSQATQRGRLRLECGRGVDITAPRSSNVSGPASAVTALTCTFVKWGGARTRDQWIPNLQDLTAPVIAERCCSTGKLVVSALRWSPGNSGRFYDGPPAAADEQR